MSNPEGEARLVQAEQHHQNTEKLLEILIAQNEQNNPEKTLEALIVQEMKGAEEITGAIKELAKPLETMNQASSLIHELLKVLRVIKGDKGEPGDKGDQGDKGDSVTADEVYSLLASSAEFQTLVKGDKGDKGEDAIPQDIAERVKDAVAIILKSDKAFVDSIHGDDGDDAEIDYKKLSGMLKANTDFIEMTRGKKGSDAKAKITGKMITDTLSTLKDDERLSYESLKDRPNLETFRRGNGTGRFQELTDVDMQGIQSGQIAVWDGRTWRAGNQSGGGGFTLLQATETPNGAITVFTFPSAAAQPNFIVMDNAMMRATTKSGAVNWTWSAGPKQATMTVAPNEDIVAIV